MNYTGLTAVFKNKNQCYKMIDFLNAKELKLSIIKIQLAGDIYTGTYWGTNVYIGSMIKSMKKIK